MTKPMLNQFTTWCSRQINHFVTLGLILTALLSAWLFRNPLTRLFLSGKEFAGRSLAIQLVLLGGYFLIILFLAAGLYLLTRRVAWLNRMVQAGVQTLQSSPKLSTALLFLLLVSIFFTAWVQRVRFTDTARFGGDTWEYHSMGVNFAYGHGLQKFGGLEPFEVYKFEFDTEDTPSFYNRFFELAGNDDFLRPPAYPLFLGIIYRLFGVSPLLAQKIQLLLLAIIAASLPIIGRLYWAKFGLPGGIIAGALFLSANRLMASGLMTEPLIAFAVFLILAALVLYEKYPLPGAAIVLGICLGFGLLVKGSLNLLPLLSAGWILMRFAKNRRWTEVANLGMITLAAVLTVLPWVVYASKTAGEFIFISTQTSVQLLDDNNEWSIDGEWHPEWKDNPEAFYLNDGIPQNRPVQKVINFYWKNPGLFTRIVLNKLVKGYQDVTYLWIFLGLTACNLIFRTISFHRQKTNPAFITAVSKISIPAPMWIIFWNFLLITLVFHGQPTVYGSRYVAPMDFIFALLCSVSALQLLGLIISPAVHRLTCRFEIREGWIRRTRP